MCVVHFEYQFQKIEIPYKINLKRMLACYKINIKEFLDFVFNFKMSTNFFSCYYPFLFFI